MVDLGGGIQIEMVVLSSGTFDMGSDNGWENEKPVHRVNISSPFLMGKYEVTQGQWKSVMGSNPSRFTGNDELPVEQVSWDDCQEFIRKLNARTGLLFRLPTEAEWEYACRSGSTGDWAGNLDSMGWYYENAGRSRLSDASWNLDTATSNGNQTHSVGRKVSNSWGLYDMHGNVWEWCQDRYAENYYAQSPGTDPMGATGGSSRVIRGGAWNMLASMCRSAFRVDGTPGERVAFLGLRLARSVNQGSNVEPVITPLAADKVVDLGNGVQVELVAVPAGNFYMGGNGLDNEKPVHQVKISKSFWMGKYEVTQGLWKSIMGTNPSRFTGSEELPVEQVSWEDSQEFIRRLNMKTGLRFRLPTEAEWEYACRAETTGDWAGNLETMGWYYENSGKSRLSDLTWNKSATVSNNNQTHLVGQKQPNGWGLYDMHGNVWEWCQDWYDAGYYRRSAAVDPAGPLAGEHRVIRGGSWFNKGAFARSSSRTGSPPLGTFDGLGVRLALTQ